MVMNQVSHVNIPPLSPHILPIFFSRKLFVGGIPIAVTSEELGRFFEETFGPVADSVIICISEEGVVRSRGFGFITFESADSADQAAGQHWVPFKNRRVEVGVTFWGGGRGGGYVYYAYCRRTK